MNHPIKFGLYLPSGDYSKALAAAGRADALGYYSMSIDDHMMSVAGERAGKRGSPQLECYVTLSALAARTQRVRLLPTVTPMGYRNPALLAKMLSTLDQVSNGRVIAGVGAGWWAEEYKSFDYPYLANAERIDQLGEGIEILKALWTQEATTFSGRYYKLENAYSSPKPVQKPHPPVMIGGSAPKVLALAARSADIANVVYASNNKNEHGPVTHFSKRMFKKRIEALRANCQAIGRDPGEIEISTFVMGIVTQDQSRLRRYLEALGSVMGFESADAMQQSAMILAGTPAQVRRELQERIELGATYFLFNFADLASVELLAEKVMPEFRQS